MRPTHALSRVGALSARRVASGGESGPWRWLVPALAICLLVLAAQRVLDLDGRADGARAEALTAEALAADVVERTALVTEASFGGRVTPPTIRGLAAVRSEIDRKLLDLGGRERRSDVIALGAHLATGRRQIDEHLRSAREGRATKAGSERVAAGLRRTAALARALDENRQAEAVRAVDAVRRASMGFVGLGIGLVILLLWVFWSRRTAAQVALHDRRFRSLVQNSSDLILVVDDAGAITECTPVVEPMLGRSAEALLGTPFSALVHPDDGDAPFDGQASDWRAAHADGTWVDVESTCTDLREDPSVHGHVLVVRDIRERKAFEQQLHHQAFHDKLTGLPNRALFEDRVRQGVLHARRTGELVAVLFVDLDDFKTVNDSLGHAAGDELLRHTAERLDGSLRGSDTAARLGGDEFAILVEHVQAREDVLAVAERVHDALDRHFVVNGQEIFVRASIGVAISEDDQLDDDLLRNADTAMYAAKAGGKGRHEVFRPIMHVTARRRLQLTGDLRRAVENDEFTVDYQPLVDLAHGRIVGAEALVRWEHPEYGRLAPADFIPLAEETGLIVEIGDFVLHEACREARRWQDLPGEQRPAYVSVNLSPRQFRPPGRLIEQVQLATDAAGIPPSRLLLEITESLLMHEREHAARDLQALRDLGVRVAIDDFGTGYSSLSYLREFPIDIVKMDRSFVQNLGRRRGDDALVRSVVELGEALDMQIVAEGIEDAVQLDSLRGLQCGIGQGYYFSEPISSERMTEALQAESPQGNDARATGS